MSADSTNGPGTTDADNISISTTSSQTDNANSATSNDALTSTTTSSSAALTQRGTTGPRKNSAERSIVHTRMEDEAVQEEYVYGEILGEGSFGKVYRARHHMTGETVAIKEIVKEKAGSSGLRQLEKEVTIFKKVDHKHIIKLKEVIESPKKMYLIMELCEGGDLAKLLRERSHLTEADTKAVISSLAEAIKYLHQQGILHRDLKLENILLAEKPQENDSDSILIKVSDFGLSTQQNNNSYENMQEQYCGTPSYMAPEMNSTYSYPVDVWAMGIIMYYLLTGYPRDNELNESVAKDGPKFEEPQWEHVNEQAKDLLREMLTKDPAYRTTSGEVLNHEWFTGKKREHGNVLELMKDFGREQREGGGGSLTGCSDGEGDVTSAINGLSLANSDPQSNGSNAVSSDNASAAKKEPRKGSGGKKMGGDVSARTTPSTNFPKSSKLKVAGPHSLTPSPRPVSKTPTPKGSQEVVGRASTQATKTTFTSSKPQAASNGPSHKGSAPKIALNQKVKRK